MWSVTKDYDIESLLKDSNPLLIFKHSYRCSISSMALQRMERIHKEINENAKFVLVDVMEQRGLSLKIAEYFKIKHESPQIIFYNKNKVEFTDSHMNINSSKVLDYL
jgi:bacillithiol system protein YtxJ